MAEASDGVEGVNSVPAPTKPVPARALRQLKNADMDEFCVKASLRSAFCSDLTVDEIERITTALENRVRESSRAAVRLGLAVNMYVRREAEAGRAPAAVFDGGPLSNSPLTFLRQFILGQDATKSAHRSSDVGDFLSAYSSMLPAEPERFLHDRNIYNVLLQRYVTNYKTYLSMQFPVVLLRLCDGWCRLGDVDSAGAWRIRRAVLCGSFDVASLRREAMREKRKNTPGEKQKTAMRDRTSNIGGEVHGECGDGEDSDSGDDELEDGGVGSVQKSDRFETALSGNPDVSAFVASIRRWIVGSAAINISVYWLKSNPAAVAYFFAGYASAELERMGDEMRRRRDDGEKIDISYGKLKKLTAIPLAPLHSFAVKSIFVDTDVLEGIATEVFGKRSAKRKRNSDGGGGDQQLPVDQWRRIFSPDRFTTRNQRKKKRFVFSGSIDTDGLAFASFHHRRPKLTIAKVVGGEKVDAVEPTPASIPRRSLPDRVVAIDPGRANLFTAVEMTDCRDDDDRPVGQRIVKHQFTRQEYYARSGIDTAREHRTQWLKDSDAQRALDDFCAEKKSSPSLEAFLGYARVAVRHYDVLWAEYSKDRWRRDNMHVFSNKQRTLELVVQKILRPRHARQRTVIAYGDASIAPGGRGEKNVPVNRLRAVFERRNRGLVVPIDEYGTTKTLAKVFLDDGATSRRTGNVYASVDGDRCEWGEENASRRGRQVRGLLWCKSTTFGRRLMDRDVNAAHNILELYNSYPDRPPEMTRGSGRVPRLGYTIVVKTPKTLWADGAEKPRNRRPKQPDV